MKTSPNCARDGHQTRSFLIVFIGHSGSSALTSELRSHSQVNMHLMEHIDHDNTSNSSVALSKTKMLIQTGIEDGKVPGFKVRPKHILDALEKWQKLVREFGTRVIWQYRKNLFKASIGEYAHKVLNYSSVKEGFRSNLSREERCSLGARCRFRLHDMGFVHEALKEKILSQNAVTRALEKLVGSDACIWEVPYEDYLYHRVETMIDLQKFLGLRRKKTEPERFKAMGDNLCEVVENWEELCQNFCGCIAWQHMIDDVRYRCFCQYSGGPATYCES